MDIQYFTHIRGSSRLYKYLRVKWYIEKYMNCRQVRESHSLPVTHADSGPSEISLATTLDETQCKNSHYDHVPKVAQPDMDPNVEQVPEVGDEVSDNAALSALCSISKLPVMSIQADALKIMRKIAISTNVTLLQMNALLRIFRKLYPELPLDSRTLLRTARYTVKKSTNGLAGRRYIADNYCETAKSMKQPHECTEPPSFDTITPIDIHGKSKRPKTVSDITDEKENLPPKELSMDVDRSPPSQKPADLCFDKRDSPITSRYEPGDPDPTDEAGYEHDEPMPPSHL